MERNKIIKAKMSFLYRFSTLENENNRFCNKISIHTSKHAIIVTIARGTYCNFSVGYLFAI